MPPRADARFEALKSFVEKDPADSFSRYALALEHARRGERDEALAQLLELRSRDPKYVALYYQLGTLYADLGRPADARSAFAEGIAIARELGDEHTRRELGEAMAQVDEQ